MEATSIQALDLQAVMALISTAVGIVFVYAAVSKLFDLPAFVAGLRSYIAVPTYLVALLGGLLIACELLIGLAHATSTALPIVLPGAIVLLAIFGVNVTRSLASGEERPCLCFGAGREDRVGASSLVRIAILLLAEAILIGYLSIGGGSLSVELLRPFDIAVWFLVAISMVAIISFFFALPELYRAWRVVTT